MSTNEGLPWESDGDLALGPAGGRLEPADSEAWRGQLHTDEWPENLAGPEYWLYKKEQGDE
jgi:hypothetical protein